MRERKMEKERKKKRESVRGVNGDIRGSVANPGGGQEKQRKHLAGRNSSFWKFLR